MSNSGQVAASASAPLPAHHSCGATSRGGVLTGCKPLIFRAVGVAAACLALAACSATASLTTTGPSDAAAAAPQLAPVVAATADPALASTGPWTAAYCQATVTNLTTDAQLDRQEAARIQAQGPDPRFPRQTAAEYTAYADQWDQIRYLVLETCRVPAGGTPATCTDAILWLTQGAANHDADLQRPGATASDQTWDRTWAAFYRTLSANVSAGCAHD